MNIIKSGILFLLAGLIIPACSRNNDDTPKVAIQQVSLPAETALAVSFTEQLEPTVSPENISSNYSFRWESEDPAIVSVNERGQVKGEGKGEAIVRVTVYENGKLVSGIAASTKVNVAELTISFSQESGNLDIGKTHKLEAVVSPEGYTPTLEWSVANENIATVAEDGTITARNVGETTITASVKDKADIKAVYSLRVGAGKVNPGSGVDDIEDGEDWE